MTDTQQVAAAVEAIRRGMIAADRAALDALCLDELVYGHTSGLMQTKAEFIADVTSGKTTWKSIEMEKLRHSLAGDNAISLFTFVGANASGGQTNALRFDVVMVWKKVASQWKLLVRQAYNKV